MVKESFQSAGKNGRCIPCLHESHVWCEIGSVVRTTCDCPCEGSEAAANERRMRREEQIEEEYHAHGPDGI